MLYEASLLNRFACEKRLAFGISGLFFAKSCCLQNLSFVLCCSRFGAVSGETIQEGVKSDMS